MLHRALRNPIQPHRFGPAAVGGIVAVTQTESGTWSEDQTVGPVGGEIGAWSETQTVIVLDVDTATLTDDQSLTAAITDTDTGVWTSTQLVGHTNADTGSFTEAQGFPISSLYDEFRATSLDTSKWTAATAGGSPTASYTITGLTVSLPSSSTYTLTGTKAYALKDNSVQICLTNAVAPDTSSAFYLRMQANVGYYVAILVSGGTTPRIRIAYSNGNLSGNSLSAVYDPTNHKFLRLRESANMYYLDASSDGSTWSNVETLTVSDTTPFQLVSLTPTLVFSSTTHAASFTIDQFNILDLVDTETGTFTDAQQPTASITDADTGTIADAQQLLANITDADTGTIADDQQITTSIPDGDSAQFAEVVGVIGVVPDGVETLTLTDAQTVGLAAADTGTFIETEQVIVLDGDTGVVADDQQLSVVVSQNESIGTTELAAIGVQPMSGKEVGTWTDAQTVLANLTDTDGGTWTETEHVTVLGADSVIVVDQQQLTASITSADMGVFIDAQQLTASITDNESLNFLELADLHVTATSADVGQFVDAQSLTAEIFEAESIIFSELVDLLASITDTETGAFEETESAFLPPASVSVLDLESSSVVRVLRMVSTRVNGSLSVQWVPISDLFAPAFEGVRERTVLNHPIVGGELVVRFDLHFVRPGAAQQPPPQQGTMPDRIGVMFADPSALEWLRAGDRVQCLSGPIEGMFEIRVTPDLAMGFDAAHHLEVEVVEVSQFKTGSNVDSSIDYIQFPSYMRSLYATRAEVKRLVINDVSGGSARQSWVKTTDMVDPMLGMPGELLCRIDTAFLRKGKDQLPPPQQGSMPDRVGVLHADVTPLLKAGDRLHCVEGPLTGSVFELRVAPDLAPNLDSISHIEVQVIEVDQVDTGSHLDPSFDFLQTPSFMRMLYASQVDVLRLVTTDIEGGSASSSWVKIEDIVDPIWGVPGELMCRIATSFLRPGKDLPPPVVAGRAPDRVGVLYCDATPYLKAGDRVRCVTGDVYGTFELRVTPDLALNQTTVGHMEVQIIEVAQSLASYGHG